MPREKVTPPTMRPILIDAKTCAGLGGVSVSWWMEKVKAGKAPLPVANGNRFTRWRTVDAVSYWESFGTESLTAASSSAPSSRAPS